MTKQTSGSDESTQKKSNDNSLDKKDFQKFVAIQKVTGVISENFEFDTADNKTQRTVLADYHGWINAGRPKPQLTKEAKGKIEKILSVTRVSHIGKQFLTYIKEGDDIPTGLEYELSYAQVEQEDGSFVQDTDIVVRREPRYTIKYSDDAAKKLMERCSNESVVPKFYLALSRGRVISVQTPENFTGDFDKLMALAMKNEVI